jgi:hypothetical protein
MFFIFPGSFCWDGDLQAAEFGVRRTRVQCRGRGTTARFPTPVTNAQG